MTIEEFAEKEIADAMRRAEVEKNTGSETGIIRR